MFSKTIQLWQPPNLREVSEHERLLHAAEDHERDEQPKRLVGHHHPQVVHYDLKPA